MIVRYVQYTFPVQVPKVVLTIKIKQEQQETNKVPQAAIIFPTAALTLPNVTKLLKSLYQIVTYSTIDAFTGLTPGNVSRIVNKSKTVSKNIEKLWLKFNTQNWKTVIDGLGLSLQDLVETMNTNLDILNSAQANHANFLDVFFNQKQ